MIVHLVFFKLRPEVDEARLDEMIRTTEEQLARIPAVVAARSGRNVDSASEWPFFLEVDVPTMEKLDEYRVDPLHVAYVNEVIKPNTTDRLALDFTTPDLIAGRLAKMAPGTPHGTSFTAWKGLGPPQGDGFHSRTD